MAVQTTEKPRHERYVEQQFAKAYSLYIDLAAGTAKWTHRTKFTDRCTFHTAVAIAEAMPEEAITIRCIDGRECRPKDLDLANIRRDGKQEMTVRPALESLMTTILTRLP